ncbi:MAG: DUF4440 domain-containing protein [Propionibacteriaceae bacterium]
MAPRSVPKSSVRQARSGAATGARAASPAHDRSGFSHRGEVTRTAYEAMLERDWDGLCMLLHPYLRWTTANGTRFRGRTKVIELLQAGSPPAAPIAVELRDGQIYRWQEPP